MEKKKLVISMEATLTIELSEEEFRVLHHLTSYGLAKTFFHDFSKQIPEKRIEDALRELGIRTGEAVKSIDDAKRRVFNPSTIDIRAAGQETEEG